MDWLKSYGAGIIIVSFISAAVDMLMPTGTYKKYIKLSVGIVLIIVIITPILWLTKHNLYLSDIAINTKGTPTQQNLNDVSKNQIIKTFKDGLVTKLKSLCEENGINIFNAEFVIDENSNSKNYMKPLEVTVVMNNTTYSIKKVIEIIKDKFGIGQDKIKVINRGDGID